MPLDGHDGASCDMPRQRGVLVDVSAFSRSRASAVYVEPTAFLTHTQGERAPVLYGDLYLICTTLKSFLLYEVVQY